MTEPDRHTTPGISGAGSPDLPDERRWSRWWRKIHPLGKAYPVWIAVGLIIVLLLFAQSVGWMIRHGILGF